MASLNSEGIFNIKIPKKDYDKCLKFVEARIDGSKALYAYRGESNVSKMKEDLLVGVLGEFGAYYFFTDMGFTLDKPDLKLYKTRDKSFSSDLVVSDHNIHVKSQSLESIKRYGRSWLFQRNDFVFKNPSRKERIILTSVDLANRNVTVLAMVCPVAIKGCNGWGECKVPLFRNTKVALYLEDLQNKKLDLFKFI
jgi:hypothetical protein